MINKFANQYTNEKNTVIDEMEEFQKRLHGSSITAYALMKLGIAPKSDIAMGKASAIHAVSHAIENILNGMSAQEAIKKMGEDDEDEDNG